MLHTKRHEDRNIIGYHGTNDAMAWLPTATLTEARDVLAVYGAATRGFFARVNADGADQYVDDRALGRAVYTAEFVQTVATIIENNIKMAQLGSAIADAAAARGGGDGA